MSAVPARPPQFWMLLGSLMLALLAGCEPTPQIGAAAAAIPGTRVLTLGDIDPDEPATRVRRLQPLADYLAERLGDYGIGRGRVVIARNIDEMATLMARGDVDLLLDSPYPVLAVNAITGGEPFLLRHARGDAEYWSLIVTRKDSGLRELSDLKGHVLAFQERHSTSGFMLPAALLSARGFLMEASPRPDSPVPADHIGCYFSGDEENTVELIRSGRATAGALSEPDYRQIPPEAREQLRVLDRTISVPRQLVAARADLNGDLRQSVRELLLGLTDEDRVRLAAQDTPFGWTWKFDPLAPAVAANLEGLKRSIGAFPGCRASP